MLRPARRPSALVRPVLLTLALSPAAGCLIDTEDCGIDFVLVEGRCVPAVDPPPFRAGREDFAGLEVGVEGRDAFGASRDQGGADQGAADRPLLPPDLLPVDAGPTGFTHVLVVDRTAREEARNNPWSPGTDLDAVEVATPSGELRYAQSVSGAQINDPFQANRWTDPSAALGPPDVVDFDPEREGRVSLGSEGGYVLLAMGFDAVLSPGARLQVWGVPDPLAQDTYEVYVCPDPPLAITACRSLGVAGGVARFLVP